MLQRDIVLRAPNGLHLRVAARVVNLVKRLGGRARVSTEEHQQADAESVLDLLALGASQGTPLHIETDGPNAKEVADGLAEIFSDGAGI